MEPPVRIRAPVDLQPLHQCTFHLAEQEGRGRRFPFPDILLIQIWRRTPSVIIQPDIGEAQAGNLPRLIAQDLAGEFRPAADMTEIDIPDVRPDIRSARLPDQQRRETDLERTEHFHEDVFKTDPLHIYPVFPAVA